jgi:methylase of polypeptide subunit release factors
MNVTEWIRDTTSQLDTADVPTARLDCLVLLEDETGHDRAWLLSHPEHTLQGSELKNLSTKVAQRAQHVPLAYIRGHAEFYGRRFAVNEHTLVPRPETETMIELLKRVRNMEADVATFQVERRGRKPVKRQYTFEKPQIPSRLVKTKDGYKVVWDRPSRPAFQQPTPPLKGQSLRYHDEQLYLYDIGTGSGAIAITAKLEIPEAMVAAVDIDEACLRVTAQNAAELGADIHRNHGDLLEPLLPAWPEAPDALTILLCNLPYVPDDFSINTAASHEPERAIFGGPDGLDPYRRMFAQLNDAGLQASYILTESLPPQHTGLIGIAEAAGYRLQETDDFIQLFTSFD